jgi:hypothetical protein
MLMLPVQVDEQVTDGFEGAERHGLGIHPCDGASTYLHLACEIEQAILWLDAQRVEGGVQLRLVGQLEYRADPQAFRPRPNQSGIRPFAQHQIERTNQNRLARARLPRQHIEARRKRDIHPLDNRQILDVQLVQHRQECTFRTGV